MSVTKQHIVIATAGHIDHGKTALVRALTGEETDRLAEEKRRGITIELGFAFLGDNITIIDVPGHERFIKTMVAGVATVDLVLLIVAADDGIMPQTREHLAIIEQLGIPHLYVVITKAAGHDEDWLKLVEEEIRDIIPPKYKSSLQTFRCDSLSAEGISELKEAILEFAEETEPRRASGVFRLPVDRAFGLKGFGTVITGTLIGGSVKVGDRLQVMPSGKEARVRGLQCHGITREEIVTGERAALNLMGPEVSEIRRGDWICERNCFFSTEVIDLSLVTLADAPALKNRDRVRLHIGTDEVLGRLVLFGKDTVLPGEQVFAQFISEKPMMAVRGDRVIIRRYSPLQTLGGGTVLDPMPERKRRSLPESLESFHLFDEAPDDEAALSLKIKFSGGKGITLAKARAFLNAAPRRFTELIDNLKDQRLILQISSGEGALLIDAGVFTEVKRTVIGTLDNWHQSNPQALGMKQAGLVGELSSDYGERVVEHAIDALLRSEIMLEKGFLRRKEHIIQLDEKTEKICEVVEELMEAYGFAPPDTKEIQKKLKISEAELNRVLSLLVRLGRVVRMGDGSSWAMKNVRSAWDLIKPELSAHEGVRMADLREKLNCPRRHAVALIEFFDSAGLTTRDEDLRLPGPNFDKEL